MNFNEVSHKTIIEHATLIAFWIFEIDDLQLQLWRFEIKVGLHFAKNCTF